MAVQEERAKVVSLDGQGRETDHSSVCDGNHSRKKKRKSTRLIYFLKEEQTQGGIRVLRHGGDVKGKELRYNGGYSCGGDTRNRDLEGSADGGMSDLFEDEEDVYRRATDVVEVRGKTSSFQISCSSKKQLSLDDRG